MLRVAALVAVTLSVTAPSALAHGDVASGFPAPPPDAVVFSRELGRDDLALGVVVKPGALLLQASIVTSQGKGATGQRVMLGVRGMPLQRARTCGAGCYRTTIRSQHRPSVVSTEVGRTRWAVSMPSRWPAPNGTAIMRQAGRAWHALRSLTDFDRFASGPGRALVTRWEIEAPDRVAYQIRGGADAVIIGGKRWDRSSARAPWVESPQTPLMQPTPFWVSVEDAHVLGVASVAGRAAWRVSFFDPSTPAWFDVMIDQRTRRVLDMHMIATAHFMHDTYSHFDATPAVLPPAQ